MQLDLALFLRLSRTLEATHALSDAAQDEHDDVLRQLDRLFLAVDERMELLRTSEAVRPPVETPAEELEATKEVELAEEEEADAVPVPEPGEVPTQVWTVQHDRLYEDVLWLFKVGDNEGALVSLGRLLNVAEETPELQRFLDINAPKLAGLYERILGSFNLPIKVSDNGLGDLFFWNGQEARELLALGRKSSNIAGVLAASPWSKMKTLALVHRLHTEGLIQFQQTSLS